MLLGRFLRSVLTACWCCNYAPNAGMYCFVRSIVLYCIADGGDFGGSGWW